MEAEISAALRSVSSAIDIGKKLVDLAYKTKNSELILAIAELNLELANSKLSLANSITEIAQLKTDNEALKTKIQKLKERTTEKLVLKKGLYYTESDDGPFCTACYDSNQKKIRVAEMPSVMRTLGSHKCPVCNATFGGKL